MSVNDLVLMTKHLTGSVRRNELAVGPLRSLDTCPMSFVALNLNFTCMATRNTARKRVAPGEDPAQVAAFWTWFKSNRKRIELLAQGDREQLPLYAEMTRRMHAFHPAVHPELDVDDNGHVLIVTADGRPEGVGPVMRFTELYPVLDGWRIQRFRKPVNDPLAVFEYQGLLCAMEEARVAYAFDEAENKIHLGFVVEDASVEDERWQGMLFLLLDHAIGEYNTIMHVGGLELMKEEDLPPQVSLITLDRLREVIEEKFY